MSCCEPSSDMTASVTQTENGFTVVGSENLTYGFTFIDGVFDPANAELASIYKKWGRVLLVTDGSIERQYGQAARDYFAAHDIALTLKVMAGGEINKTMTTMLSLVDVSNSKNLDLFERFEVCNRKLSRRTS